MGACSERPPSMIVARRPLMDDNTRSPNLVGTCQDLVNRALPVSDADRRRPSMQVRVGRGDSSIGHVNLASPSTLHLAREVPLTAQTPRKMLKDRLAPDGPKKMLALDGGGMLGVL